METVRVRGQPAHRVKGHRVARYRRVLAPPAISPGDRQFDFLIARGDAHLVGEPAYRRRRYAGDFSRPFGRVVVEAVAQQLKCRFHRSAVGKFEFTEQKRIGAVRVVDHGTVGETVPPQLVVAIMRDFLFATFVACDQAVIVARRVLVHEVAGIRVLGEELAIIQSARHDLMTEREQQRAVGARLDRHPLVGDRRVTGAHRIDRDETPAAALEFRDGDLERVGMVVLRRADHDEELGPLEIGAAEFPE